MKGARSIPVITKHATGRGKERLGWCRNTLTRMAEKALNEGVTHAQTRGRLNRYLTMLYLQQRQADNIRVFGEHVFIFAGNSLITILRLPRQMRRAARDAGTQATR